jgi:hypothetical protein
MDEFRGPDNRVIECEPQSKLPATMVLTYLKWLRGRVPCSLKDEGWYSHKGETLGHFTVTVSQHYLEDKTEKFISCAKNILCTKKVKIAIVLDN